MTERVEFIDELFSALAHMGVASHQMSWANTLVSDVDAVPDEVKKNMKNINNAIHELQIQIREIREGAE